MCPGRYRNRYVFRDNFLVTADDTAKDAEALAKKILTLRLFEDESGKQMWKRSVKDIDGEILCGALPLALPGVDLLCAVSQFTLHAVTAKGAKPDFHSNSPLNR